jgi:hypothetical protein
MNCSICGQPETHLNINTGRREKIKHPPDVKAIVCSNCMQRLLSSPQDELKAAYQKAIRAGEPGKAKALEGFIIDRETRGNGHGESDTPKRVDGKRPMRIDRNDRKANWSFKKGKRTTLHKVVSNA